MLYPLSYGGRVCILSITLPDGAMMRDEPLEKEIQDRGGRIWRVIGWMALGGVICLVLVAAFLAYGQPELLLEQLNLRYCG